jgi:integrase
MANDVLRWVKRMFDYGTKRQIVTVQSGRHSINLADAGGKEESRDRWLTKSGTDRRCSRPCATAKGWNTSQHAAPSSCCCCSPCRREELIAAPLSRIRPWITPSGTCRAERTKTGKAIDIPLPRQAVAILRDLIRLGNGSAWLLPARKMQERMIPHIDLNTVGAALAQERPPD